MLLHVCLICAMYMLVWWCVVIYTSVRVACTKQSFSSIYLQVMFKADLQVCMRLFILLCDMKSVAMYMRTAITCVVSVWDMLVAGVSKLLFGVTLVWLCYLSGWHTDWLPHSCTHTHTAVHTTCPHYHTTYTPYLHLSHCSSFTCLVLFGSFPTQLCKTDRK